MPGDLIMFLPTPQGPVLEGAGGSGGLQTPESNRHVHTSIRACNLRSCRERGLCLLSSKHSHEHHWSLSYTQERGEHEIRGPPWLRDLEALLICNKTIAELPPPPRRNQGSYEE